MTPTKEEMLEMATRLEKISMIFARFVDPDKKKMNIESGLMATLAAVDTLRWAAGEEPAAFLEMMEKLKALDKQIDAWIHGASTSSSAD